MTETQGGREDSPHPTVVLAPILALLLEKAEAFKEQSPTGKGTENLYEVTLKALIPGADVAVLFQLSKQHSLLAEIRPTGTDGTGL